VSDIQPAKYCNKCGRSCLNYWSENGASNYCLEVKYDASYGSYALADGLRYKFILCEGCLSEIIKSLTVTPRVVDWLHSGIFKDGKETSDEHLEQDKYPQYWFPEWNVHPADEGPPAAPTPYLIGWRLGRGEWIRAYWEKTSVNHTPEENPYLIGSYDWGRFIMGYAQGIKDGEDDDIDSPWMEPPP